MNELQKIEYLVSVKLYYTALTKIAYGKASGLYADKAMLLMEASNNRSEDKDQVSILTRNLIAEFLLSKQKETSKKEAKEEK